MTDRSCGSCQLCCTLLPVNESFIIDSLPFEAETLVKPALTRCKHQRFKKGCNIYDKRPLSCRAFECGWLSRSVPETMLRPDRCGYVIDPNPDTITYVPEDGSPAIDIPVVQVWIDSRKIIDKATLRMDAGMGDYLEQLANEGKGVIFRDGSRRGYVMFRLDGEWIAGEGNLKPGSDQLNDAFTAYVR